MEIYSFPWAPKARTLLIWSLRFFVHADISLSVISPPGRRSCARFFFHQAANILFLPNEVGFLLHQSGAVWVPHLVSCSAAWFSSHYNATFTSLIFVMIQTNFLTTRTICYPIYSPFSLFRTTQNHYFTLQQHALRRKILRNSLRPCFNTVSLPVPWGHNKGKQIFPVMLQKLTTSVHTAETQIAHWFSLAMRALQQSTCCAMLLYVQNSSSLWKWKRNKDRGERGNIAQQWWRHCQSCSSFIDNKWQINTNIHVTTLVFACIVAVKEW